MPVRLVRHYCRTTQDFSRNAKLYLASTFLSGMSFSIFGVIFNLYLTEGRFREQFIGNIISLPFLLTLGVERYLPFAVVAFWLRSAFMNMGGPISSSFMMELVPEDRRATASSLAGMSWNLTWAASASASGWIMQRYGYEIPFFITAFLYAVAAMSFYMMFGARESGEKRGGKGDKVEKSKGDRKP